MQFYNELTKKFKISNRARLPLFILLVLCPFFSSTNGQDSVGSIKIPSISIPSNFYSDTSSLIVTNNRDIEMNGNPYESLRDEASNNNFTKFLYDLVIVSDKKATYNSVDAPSDQAYNLFEGMIISEIDIHTMAPYGAKLEDININNVVHSTNFVNKTHVKTREQNIQKHLFFTIGDTVNSLMLSDNERSIRDLPYIYDCRVVVVPLSETEVKVVILTKDLYSLGLTTSWYHAYREGSALLYERNLFGIGHELSLKVPFDTRYFDNIKLGYGATYKINNLFKQFATLSVSYLDSLDIDTYGISLSRDFYNSSTKYAGGISLTRNSIRERPDSLFSSMLGRYDHRKLWLARSFLIEDDPVTRIVLGFDYTYNNPIARPVIEPHSYQYYQTYHSLLGSITLSSQKYHKTNLLYGYGRTEDIPYGGMINITLGKEYGEFQDRYYIGSILSFGRPINNLGYLYASVWMSSYDNDNTREQGVFLAKANYISNLRSIGAFRMRNFLKVEYVSGFNRYSDEYLEFLSKDGFSGFRNDSITGDNRFTASFESVLFGPRNIWGFKFAYYLFGDIGYIYNQGHRMTQGDILSSIGLGVRMRNDNLIINTIVVRLAYYPSLPPNSYARWIMLSGERSFQPENFEPTPPAVIPYYTRRR